jgi:hypothetical protein
MSLDKTEKELYNPKSDIENRGHDSSAFDIDETVNSDSENIFEGKKSSWQRDSAPFLTQDRKKALVVGGSILGALLFIVVSVLGVIKFKQGSFSQDRVSMSIEGSAEAKSVKESSYVIKYENNNRTELENVEIVLNHSENFYPEESSIIKKDTDRSSKINIGKIKAKEKGQVEVVGKFYAAENFTVYLNPVMTYKPSNSSSEFRVDSQISVKITTSPINLKIVAPKEALNESSASYEITYKNTGTIPFDGLNLRLEYSDGFIFQKASIPPVENDNLWHIGRLDIGEEKTLTLQGGIQGNRFDVKSIKATIYRNDSGQKEVIFGKAEEVTKVVVPPLTVMHTINGKKSLNVNLGDKLNYRISYANNGDLALRDVIIRLKIDSSLVDYKKLSLRKGSYDSSSSTITWKAPDIEKIKNLEPGDSGVIDFTIPLKKRIEIKSVADKNFVIDSLVTIDSSDIAHDSLGSSKNISNRILAKLNSKVILEQDAFFEEGLIENSGPVPPKIGEETTYTIHWKVSNISNDISEVKVRSYLPTWVKWKDVTVPNNERISFNKRINEVVWDIGKIENAAGVLSDPREVSFKVGIVPEVNQIGEAVTLVKETTLTAKDDFTNSLIEKSLLIQSNMLKNESGRYQVVE